MKVCPNCRSQLNDDALFCKVCGTNVANMGGNGYQNQGYGNQQEYNNQNGYGNQQGYNNQNSYANQQSYIPNWYDHTTEFERKDVSENKVYAMAAYLLGTIGVIIALLASRDSEYVKFHVRQSLKFTVTKILIGIVTLILCWTIIVPIAAGITILVLGVVKIICFFQICSGKSVEPVILRSLGFMR